MLRPNCITDTGMQKRGCLRYHELNQGKKKTLPTKISKTDNHTCIASLQPFSLLPLLYSDTDEHDFPLIVSLENSTFKAQSNK